MLSKQIESLVDKLTATYLAKGVQPSDIADTLFEENYVDMKITKAQNRLVMTFTFEEVDEEGTQTLNSMRYTYSSKKQLLRVEQKVGKSRYRVQWDRDEDLQNTLSQLLLLVPYSSAWNSLVNTLPEELRGLVCSSLAA